MPVASRHSIVKLAADGHESENLARFIGSILAQEHRVWCLVWDWLVRIELA